MNWRTPFGAVLACVHLGLAIYLVLCVALRRNEARDQADALRAVAERELADTDALRRQVEVLRAQKAGLEAGDPYVIELMARSRYDWRGPGEVTPPPVPVAPSAP